MNADGQGQTPWPFFLPFLFELLAGPGYDLGVTDEELCIVNFLKGSPGTWYARREIARRAVKRRIFEENQHWLDGALAALVDRREIEMENGHYRISSGVSEL